MENTLKKYVKEYQLEDIKVVQEEVEELNYLNGRINKTIRYCGYSITVYKDMITGHFSVMGTCWNNDEKAIRAAIENMYMSTIKRRSIHDLGNIESFAMVDKEKCCSPEKILLHIAKEYSSLVKEVKKKIHIFSSECEVEDESKYFVVTYMLDKFKQSYWIKTEKDVLEANRSFNILVCKRHLPYYKLNMKSDFVIVSSSVATVLLEHLFNILPYLLSTDGRNHRVGKINIFDTPRLENITKYKRGDSEGFPRREKSILKDNNLSLFYSEDYVTSFNEINAYGNQDRINVLEMSRIEPYCVVQEYVELDNAELLNEYCDSVIIEEIYSQECRFNIETGLLEANAFCRKRDKEFNMYIAINLLRFYDKVIAVGNIDDRIRILNKLFKAPMMVISGDALLK